ncbi:MAG: cation diffusion facilitator family transporter [Clostridia bacterium]|nr:cation diffusion facilitator family transporter [Clostridia bacterium]
MNRDSVIRRLTLVSIFGNLILSAFKFLAGIFGCSQAMVSDAVHSMSDVLTTFIAAAGVRISGRRADKEHPYGHERFECIASLLLCVILAVTGVEIGLSGIRTLRGGTANMTVPTLLPLIAAVVSILGKELMYRYTIHWADKIDSAAFRADAWHHRSDALSSIGSFAGILAARLGFPWMDPIAAIVICLFILKASFDIMKEAVNGMLDTACDPATERHFDAVIANEPGVVRVDDLKTRRFGSRVYLDVEIACDASLTLTEAHAVAERVHDRIELEFPNVKHVMVHVNPA